MLFIRTSPNKSNSYQATSFVQYKPTRPADDRLFANGSVLLHVGIVIKEFRYYA
jgi:hypothetical protein